MQLFFFYSFFVHFGDFSKFATVIDDKYCVTKICCQQHRNVNLNFWLFVPLSVLFLANIRAQWIGNRGPTVGQTSKSVGGRPWIPSWYIAMSLCHVSHSGIFNFILAARSNKNSFVACSFSKYTFLCSKYEVSLGCPGPADACPQLDTSVLVVLYVCTFYGGFTAWTLSIETLGLSELFIENRNSCKFRIEDSEL